MVGVCYSELTGCLMVWVTAGLGDGLHKAAMESMCT